MTWQATRKSELVGGVRLSCEESGDGVPVVLIHGIPAVAPCLSRLTDARVKLVGGVAHIAAAQPSSLVAEVTAA